jgi:hypothetical protein
MAQQQCLGRPLFVRSIRKFLIPRIALAVVAGRRRSGHDSDLAGARVDIDGRDRQAATPHALDGARDLALPERQRLSVWVVLGAKPLWRRKNVFQTVSYNLIGPSDYPAAADPADARLLPFRPAPGAAMLVSTVTMSGERGAAAAQPRRGAAYRGQYRQAAVI